MQRQEIIANPFALMMDPDAVVQEMERSERLNHLNRRICRPLDKPLIPKVEDEAVELDDAIETEFELMPTLGDDDELMR